MLRLVNTFTVSLVLVSLSGCSLFDSNSDSIVDDYEVAWIDLPENRSLYKGEALVSAYVFEVGHNNKFIYAKQHPLLPESPEKIDDGTVNYYIIEQTKNGFQDKPVYGPLTRQGFDSLCVHLNIQRPVFDMTYPSNL